MKVKRLQTTFTFNDAKITVITATRSSMKNFCGYKATILDNVGNKMVIPMINTLSREDALIIAYTRFIRLYH